MKGNATAPRTGLEWAKLLCERSGAADDCDWTSFDGRAWHYLLCRRPGFAARWDWSSAAEWSKEDWAALLSRQPQLAEKCDRWEEFDGGDLETMGFEGMNVRDPAHPGKTSFSLEEANEKTRRKWMQPRRPLLKKLELVDAGKQGGAVQAMILNWNHDLSRCRFNHFTGRDWRDFLLHFWMRGVPGFVLNAVFMPCKWSLLDGKDWSELLSKKPRIEFQHFCDWKKLGIDDWRTLLRSQPEFKDRFESCMGMKYEDLNMENNIPRGPW